MIRETALSSHDYTVFGLTVRSDIPLPELFPAVLDAPPDVTIRSRAARDVQSDRTGFTIVDGALVLAVPDIGMFRIRDGSTIDVEPGFEVPERNVRLYLLGSAFGALLHQRGLLPLHANAVEMEGRAVAFMGPSGAGKSTLAAWLHDRGHRVIADDVCVIRFDQDGRPFVTPGPPRVRLWAEAIDALGRPSAGLERSYVAADAPVDKFDVPLGRGSGGTEKFPLGAVYLLDRGQELGITSVVGVEAAEALFANTYRGAFVALAGSEQEHFSKAVRVAQRTPIFRIERSWNMNLVSEQLNVIVDHAQETLRWSDLNGG